MLWFSPVVRLILLKHVPYRGEHFASSSGNSFLLSPSVLNAKVKLLKPVLLLHTSVSALGKCPSEPHVTLLGNTSLIAPVS